MTTYQFINTHVSKYSHIILALTIFSSGCVGAAVDYDTTNPEGMSTLNGQSGLPSSDQDSSDQMSDFSSPRNDTQRPDEPQGLDQTGQSSENSESPLSNLDQPAQDQNDQNSSRAQHEPEHIKDRGDTFQWSAHVEINTSLSVEMLQGQTVFRPSPDGHLRVRATKTSQHSNLDSVAIELIYHEAGVTICTIYPDVPGEEPNVCRIESLSSLGAVDNDVQVNFEIEVPDHMDIYGAGSSAMITGEGLQNPIIAQTVSGPIYIETTSIAIAGTVSGSIDAIFDPSLIERYTLDRLEFYTTSGQINLSIPSTSSVYFAASTVSGAVQTDFSLPNEGQRDLEGAVNGGDVEIISQSVSGSISLLRQ